MPGFEAHARTTPASPDASPWFDTVTVAVNVPPRTGTAGLTSSDVTAKSGFTTFAGFPNEVAHMPAQTAAKIQTLLVILAAFISVLPERIYPS